jgi:hypothetical protein
MSALHHGHIDFDIYIGIGIDNILNPTVAEASSNKQNQPVILLIERPHHGQGI